VPDAVRELTEAIRLTVEYAGNDLLPAIPGWSWYDALVKYAPDVAQAFVDKPVHLTPTPEPTVKTGATHARAFIEWLASMDDPDNAEGLEVRRKVTLTDIIDRGRLALIADGTTPEPTVTPDTSIVVGQQMCKPDRETVAKVIDQVAIDYANRKSDVMPDGLGLADAILALLPGKTEREVAEAAWDYASGEFENWYNSPFKDREPPENPYRAKGASND
jgi:hypothetical protein